MEFRLTYAGPLAATQGNEVGSRWSPKLQQKHEIRQRFHPQLKRLWDTTPFLKTGGRSGPSALVTEDSPDIPPYDVAALAAKYSLYGWNFVPLVTEELNLICGLDILFLRPSAPGQLVSGGDLDNRLKTLFDALRIPEANERYAARVPDDPDEKPFYCLLSDDKLITKVSLETDQLLEFVGSGANADDVRLVITVRLRPYEMHLGNMQFG
jgi:hypothetical protein